MCPHHNGSGRVGREGGRGEPVGGVMWPWSWLVDWLACTGGLEMPGEGGPICAEADIFQGFCLEGVLYTDEHSLLDGPGMPVDFLVHYVELVGVHGVSCGGTVEVYRGRDFEMFLNSVT